MSYQKGHPYYGTLESRMKISLALKGRKNPYAHGLPKGYKHSEETKRKLSLSHMGTKYPNRKKPPEPSLELRRKYGEKNRGVNNPNWRGGVSKESELIRKTIEYGLWRGAVYARDNWTCQKCGKRGLRLNADHIKPFATYPELRFAIDNGQTLCKSCHYKKTAIDLSIINKKL